MSSENLFELFNVEQTDSLCGKMFAHYEIEQKLGEGGMGAVYRAYDTRLRNTVALKVIQGKNTLQSVQRFLREASAMAQLNHPGIVRFYEAGENPQPYFTMEYIEGFTLAQAIKEKHVTFDFIVDVIIQICEALQAAHRKQILHRDIKPSNIMIDRQGQAKIMDFGLAKQVAEDGLTQLSQEGRPLGTFLYMSPEQVRGQTSISSDVYSLGATLYEAITYRPVFQGDQIGLMYQIFHDDPLLPRKLNPAISPYLEAICLKCIHKKPEKRYKNFGALAADLRNFKSHRPISAKKYNQWHAISNFVRRNKIACSVIVTVFLCMTVALVLIMRSQAIAMENAQVAQENERIAQLRTTLEQLTLIKYDLSQLNLRQAHNYFENIQNSNLEKMVSRQKYSSNALGNANSKDNIAFLCAATKTMKRYIFSHLPTINLVKKGEKFTTGQLINTYQFSHRFLAFEEKNQCIVRDMQTLAVIANMGAIAKEHPNIGISFSNDNRLIAFYANNKLRIANVQTKRFFEINIPLETKDIHYMKISPNNRYICIGRGDHGFLIDVKQQQRYKLDIAGVPAFSRDSEVLFIAEPIRNFEVKSSIIKIDDFLKGVPSKVNEEICAKFLSLGCKDQSLIAMYLNDIEIHYLTSSKNKIKKTFTIPNAHFGKCVRMTISEDGSTLATLAVDDKLKLWDLSQRTKIWELSIPELQYGINSNNIRYMKFSQNNERLNIIISYKRQNIFYSLDVVAFDKKLNPWQQQDLFAHPSEKKFVKSKLPIMTTKQMCTAISHNGDKVAYYLFPYLYTWDTTNNKITILDKNTLTHFLGDCQEFRFMGNYLLFVGRLDDKTLFYCWDTNTGKEVFFKDYFDKVTLLFDGNYIFVRKNKNELRCDLYQFQDGKLLETKHQVTYHVEIGTYGDETRHVAYTNWDESSIWLLSLDYSTQRKIDLAQYNANTIRALRFLGNKLFVGTQNGDIFIADIKSGDVTLGPKIHESIKQFFFSGETYFVKTANQAYLLPPLHDFQGIRFFNMMPMPILGGRYFQNVEMSKDLSSGVLLKSSGEVLFYSF